MDNIKKLELIEFINEQAEDEGLWFIAQTAAEDYLQRKLRELHAAVENHTCSDGWLPIESAPKDGKTHVDLWAKSPYEESKRFSDCMWLKCFSYSDNNYFRWVGLPENLLEWKPTHWRPTPLPPKVDD